jgi:hypothetical protein
VCVQSEVSCGDQGVNEPSRCCVDGDTLLLGTGERVRALIEDELELAGYHARVWWIKESSEERNETETGATTISS